MRVRILGRLWDLVFVPRGKVVRIDHGKPRDAQRACLLGGGVSRAAGIGLVYEDEQGHPWMAIDDYRFVTWRNGHEVVVDGPDSRTVQELLRRGGNDRSVSPEEWGISQAEIHSALERHVTIPAAAAARAARDPSGAYDSTPELVSIEEAVERLTRRGCELTSDELKARLVAMGAAAPGCKASSLASYVSAMRGVTLLERGRRGRCARLRFGAAEDVRRAVAEDVLTCGRCGRAEPIEAEGMCTRCLALPRDRPASEPDEDEEDLVGDQDETEAEAEVYVCDVCAQPFEPARRTSKTCGRPCMGRRAVRRKAGEPDLDLCWARRYYGERWEPDREHLEQLAQEDEEPRAEAGAAWRVARCRRSSPRGWRRLDWTSFPTSRSRHPLSTPTTSGLLTSSDLILWTGCCPVQAVSPARPSRSWCPTCGAGLAAGCALWRAMAPSEHVVDPPRSRERAT